MDNPVNKPIKRIQALQPFSREHHFSLQFCWKIRQGLKNDIAIERIKRYADWFSENYLFPHFDLEERYIFTVLGDDHHLVKKALTEHRRIKRLLGDTEDIKLSLNRIEEELESHIRFEERVLFKEVQNVATPAQLKDIEIHHTDPKVENWDDEFWIIAR